MHNRSMLELSRKSSLYGIYAIQCFLEMVRANTLGILPRKTSSLSTCGSEDYYRRTPTAVFYSFRKCMRVTSTTASGEAEIESPHTPLASSDTLNAQGQEPVAIPRHQSGPQTPSALRIKDTQLVQCVQSALHIG